ncbi:MAG: dihydroorotate dehydrogenase electron transfer subunit [Clostridia bacterium]|nr:dihydroorotate dehydrogenase electron transfer subunit [Clostridia bacterium]
MRQGTYVIRSNEPLNVVYHRMILEGDTSAITAPGQFVNIKLESFPLRRPMSIHDWDESGFCVIYKPVGRGTEYMTALPAGTALDVLCGLGNGYSLPEGVRRPLLLGGGSGCAPLYALAKACVGKGVKPTAVLGYNTKDEVYGEDLFARLGLETYVTTADGSYGRAGFVTDVMSELEYDYFFTCGPMPMYRAIERTARTSGQYSFEERMGCGFGACMGCSVMTKSGPRRVCKDGPVFRREEILWPTQA